MNRRLFLRGIGGAALAVPFLNSLGRSARAQEAPSPRRLVIFYTNNGCLTNRWFPTGIENGAGNVTAASLETTQADGKPRTLAALAPFASKLLFPRGLAMPLNGFNNKVDGTEYFDPHDQGMGSKLTCAPLDPTGDHWALSHSLDHEIAQRFNPGTNKVPLVLSVGNAFTNVKGIVSYSAPKTPYAPVTNARTVYSSLTGLFVSGSETEADYRVARGESIIDLVSRDLNAYKARKMSGADRKKIDDWLSLLRETEQRVVPSACTAESATALGVTDAALTQAGYPARGGGFPNSETVYTLGSEMMIRLIALTMMCDNNRSIVLQWPGFVTFKWDGIAHTHDHHGLSHRNGSAAVGGQCVSGVIEQIHEIDRWYAGRYAKLVKTLDSIEEGGGTMLDNSAVMWLPELADGNAHNNNNLPIVIAGSAGGYLKQGVSVNVAGGKLEAGNSEATCSSGTEGENNSGNTGSSGGTVPLNKLYTTLINALGAGTPDWTPVDRFGVSDAVAVGFGGSGPSFTTDGAGKVTDGPGISKPGELDAIKA
ncbi:DUF1552 domain-containing protein [Sorangium sp. So ce302]|uniref:DUF1552 domain-containing protein n=1 Tax=unclassified Sorangium TaxID=2621164 RepID=UPI003F642A0D